MMEVMDVMERRDSCAALARRIWFRDRQFRPCR